MPETLTQVMERIEQAIEDSCKGGSVDFAMAKVSVGDLRLLLAQIERLRNETASQA